MLAEDILVKMVMMVLVSDGDVCWSYMTHVDGSCRWSKFFLLSSKDAG